MYDNIKRYAHFVFATLKIYMRQKTVSRSQQVERDLIFVRYARLSDQNNYPKGTNMRKTSFKGGTLLAPLPPAMVSCGDMENSNIITIGWTGILNSTPPITYISVRPSRHSYSMIRERGEFVINLTSESLAKAADYCGIYTGAKVDKFAKCGLTKEEATQVSCPMIAEAPISIECRVRNVVPLGSHDVFVADILAVNVSDEYLDESGKIRMDKASLVAYAHGEYFALGRKLGSFGFSTKKKKKKTRK